MSDIKDAILIWCNPTSVENNKIKFEIIIKLIANNKENVFRKTDEEMGWIFSIGYLEQVRPTFGESNTENCRVCFSQGCG